MRERSTCVFLEIQLSQRSLNKVIVMLNDNANFLNFVYIVLETQKARAQAGGTLTDGLLKQKPAAVNTLDQSILTWKPPGGT